MRTIENCLHQVNADRVKRPDTKKSKFSKSGEVAGEFMLEEESNRDLLTAWRGGNSAAATVLVRRYMARLQALASSRLSKKLARRVDAGDIVMSAWRSFFVATDRSRVDVPDDDNLWPLLVTMTLRKLARQAAKHSAECRSINSEIQSFNLCDWPDIVARDPTPPEAAMVTDEIEHLMSELSVQDREILCRRLQGEQQAEIATALDCSERTVRRLLKRICERYTNTGLAEENLEITWVGPESRTQSRPPKATASDRISNPFLFERPTFDFTEVVLKRLVGQGAFGKVYEATQCSDGRTIAVKYLRKSLWRDETVVGQLIRESSIVSELSHPGIVKHSGWGKARKGGVFSVMEWIDGEDLDSWLREHQPSFAEVIRCGVEICGALAAAHESGVTHADLTPRNILRRRDGTFVLTDFGFSKLQDDAVAKRVAGTPGFLAPEQLSDAFGPVSQGTDVFGVGGVLYFLLTGKPPSVGRGLPDIFARTLSSQSLPRVQASVPEVDLRLDNLIADCLSKESASRPHSVVKVAQRLTDIGNFQTFPGSGNA